MNNIVVTGAAHGLGRAFANNFLKKGARVWALDKDVDALAKLEEEEDSPRLVTRSLDVTEPAAFAKLTADLRARGDKPDLWINNAGIAVTGTFQDTPAEAFDRVLNVNLLGTIHGTRAALDLMQAPERGTIVNISSASAEVPAPFMSAYVTSKAAVTGFSRSLREELQQTYSPIRVVLVNPGFIDTRILDHNPDIQFPSWLRGLLPSPDAVAKKIIAAIECGKDEIQPTWNGQLITACHRVAPGTTLRASGLLAARDWKQALGLTPLGK